MVLADEMQLAIVEKKKLTFECVEKGCNFFQPAKECNEEKLMQLRIAFNS